MLKTAALSIVLSIALMSSAMAQTAKVDKPLDDGSGTFAQLIGAWYAEAAAKPERLEAIQPFVMGLYGFKALRFTNVGLGKLEARHLNICRIILGIYDDEIDAHLQMLSEKGEKASGFYFPTEAERAVVQKYVVQKYGAKYMGFSADLTSGKEDKVGWWKFTTGSALGELAADVTGWYLFPNNDGYDKRVQEKLQGLDRSISSAPSGAPAAFLSDLRKLKALGTKPKFTYPERVVIAAALKQALTTATGIADLPSAPAAPLPPKPVSFLDKAVGTYQVTNTMLGRSSQLELRLTKPDGIAAEMTDSGGARTLKFDSFKIAADGTYTFKLTHKNGAVMSGSGRFTPDFSALSGDVSHRAAASTASVSSKWAGKRKLP